MASMSERTSCRCPTERPGDPVRLPGNGGRAAVLWLTPLQVETLVFAELGYRLGRLDHAQFEIDEVEVTVDAVFAFIGRTGALRLDGKPVALAAVPHATALPAP